MLNEYTELLSCFELGDMEAFYVRDRETGCVGLMVLPAGMKEQAVSPRGLLPQTVEIRNFLVPKMRADFVDSLVQLKCVGDAYPGGFSQGRTMRNSGTVDLLTYQGQDVQEDAEKTVITTRLGIEGRLACEHVLCRYACEDVLRVKVNFRNVSDSVERLEMLAAFSLWGITPFDEGDASGKLRLNRFRTNWSTEGRRESRLLEELHIERSWSGHPAIGERFGQAGSMPVREYFPFMAVEDTNVEVCWGAQLTEPGSWQMEVRKQGDKVCLSGGLADRELGHWMKEVGPGESFSTREAFISVCRGDWELLCERLLSGQKRAAEAAPAIEKDMPIVFNEWCTSWGNPSQAGLERLADRLTGTGIEYLMVDAGWYKQEGSSWDKAQGDWKVYEKDFPAGIKAAADAIRARGMVPGLWFEFEVVGTDAEAMGLSEHFLKRDGKPIRAGERYFWDFRDPFVIEYLSERVTGLLKECGFGYLKIDYNETIGIGVDGAESLGEGLREHLEGVEEFMRSLRREIPELVIEVCSSGGHRLVPGMLALGSMCSFSDAHETVEIPLVAASLGYFVLGQQLQVWSVLRKTDDMKRAVYSLSATFLGRMCISGDVYDLDAAIWDKTIEATELYKRVCHIIRDGSMRRLGGDTLSWRYPRGTQTVVRMLDDNSEGVLVLHRFKAEDGEFSIELPLEGMEIGTVFAGGEIGAKIEGKMFTCRLDEDFSGCVVHLRKE